MALEKQSQRFITHMEGFLLRLEDELMDFTPVEYKNVTMTEAEMLDLFSIINSARSPCSPAWMLWQILLSMRSRP